MAPHRAQSGRFNSKIVLEELNPAELLNRLLLLGGFLMRPSEVLEMNRRQVRDLVSSYRTSNPRVFGSVLHGTDKEGSDLDILVDVLPGATLLDLGGLLDDLESLLGIHVDLVTPRDLPSKIRAKVLEEAKAV
ncbi:nucleotidyltransferase domain protein [Acidithrix ferrooxidans]|uniref:Nucleotidyltransferase domain protein n=2 Tax=Acidimicrobiaceae TaxID=84994 RepID=A0A0D8HHQ1_9ACTN|nr:nucleotidyltransferase domain protein [Acidithrix ferrooxidans]